MVNDVSLNAQPSLNAVNQLQQSAQNQKVHHHKHKSAEQMFNSLSKDVGADGNGITKDELQNYLDKLQSDGTEDSSRKAKLISNMISNFDKLSGGTDTITAASFKTGIESLRPNSQQTPSQGPPPQSPSEVTSDQLQSPIDLRIM